METPVPPHVCSEQGNFDFSQKAVETHNRVLNHLAKLQFNLAPKKTVQNLYICSYSDVLFIPPTSMLKIGLLNNFDFWRFFHVTRSRAEIIIEEVTRVAGEMEIEPCALTSTLPIYKIVLLCLWYLTNDKSSLAEAVGLFEISSVSIVNAALERGFRLMANLKNKVVTWPSRGLYLAVARDIEQKYKIINCVGSIGHEIFTAQNGDKIMLQAICNKVYKFAAVHVTSDINMPLKELFSSGISSNLFSIPKDYFVLGIDEYSKYFHQDLLHSAYHIRTTLKDMKEKNPELQKQINGILEKTIDIVNLTITETVERFPRLKNLPTNMPEVIISAVVIQNLCCNDLPPFKFVV